MTGKRKDIQWQRIPGWSLLLAALLMGCRGGDPRSGSPADRPSGGAVISEESTGDRTLSATGGVSATSAHTPKGRQRIILLGTSLTAGLGLDPGVAYPALLQQKIDSAGLPFTLVNAGLSGETSAGALRRARWVLDQPAALVVLEVGANDGLRGVDPDTTYANLVAVIRTVHAVQPAAQVLLVQMEAPTNLGARYTARFHAAYTRAAQETKTPLLPFLLLGVAGDPRFNQADGIHPNVVGSRRVAATMWGALAPRLRALAR
ncbi:MAG: arylesterase [Gemmatimonadaceae bacterium]